MRNADTNPGKNPEIYEVLTLFFGFFGLNRLYLGEPGSMLTRLLYLGCALALALTAVALLSMPVFAAAAFFVALLLVLWARDYATLHRQVQFANARRLRKKAYRG